MPAVSNTSPILNLAIIGQMDLLGQQFGEVLIPLLDTDTCGAVLPYHGLHGFSQIDFLRNPC